MNDPHAAARQLDELLERLGEQTLSDADRQQLNSLLREYPELRGRYLEAVYIQGALVLRGLAIPPTVTRSETEPDVSALRLMEISRRALAPGSATLKTTDAERDGYFTPRAKRGLVVVLVLASVAASLAVMAFWPRTAPPPVVDRPAEPATTTVARLGRTLDAVWETDAPSAALHPGSRLDLQRGLVELRFASGARVVVEGPAAFSIVDRNAARLDAGRLVAHIGPEARGFRVDTPLGAAIDHGTQLGLFVRPAISRRALAPGSQDQPASNPDSENQASGGRKPPGGDLPADAPTVELAVFEGEVEWQSQSASEQQPSRPAAKAKTLTADQAIVIEASGPGETTKASRIDYVHELPDGSDLLASQDFEALPINSPPAILRQLDVKYARNEAGRVQRIVVRDVSNENRKLSGDRLLRFEDTLGYRHHPNPEFGLQFADVPLDQALIVEFDIRPYAGSVPLVYVPRRNLVVRVGPEVEIRTEGTPRLPATLAPSLWHHVRLVVPPNADPAAKVRVDVWKRIDGKWEPLGTVSGVPPASRFSEQPVNGVTWGFEPAREHPEGGTFELDNIQIRTTRSDTSP